MGTLSSVKYNCSKILSLLTNTELSHGCYFNPCTHRLTTLESNSDSLAATAANAYRINLDSVPQVRSSSIGNEHVDKCLADVMSSSLLSCLYTASDEQLDDTDDEEINALPGVPNDLGAARRKWGGIP